MYLDYTLDLLSDLLGSMRVCLQNYQLLQYIYNRYKNWANLLLIERLDYNRLLK